MIEIKLRAWDKKDKYMFRPSSLHFSSSGSFLYVINPYLKERYSRDIELMRYIGLMHPHEREIYGEDIAKYKDEHGIEQIGLVVDLGWEVYIQAVGGDDEGNQDLELHPDYCYGIEIIGNKFETPELLERK